MLTVQGPTVNHRANTTLTPPSTKTHQAGTVDVRCEAKPTSSLSSSTEGTRQSYVCSASDREGLSDKHPRRSLSSLGRVHHASSEESTLQHVEDGDHSEENDAQRWPPKGQ